MKKIFKVLGIIAFSLCVIFFSIQCLIICTSKDRIISLDEVKDLRDIDCILVLGAGIKGDKPSPMLKERLDKSIEVYNLNVTGKLLMTGDHTRNNHDEVDVMKSYAINSKISSQDIFLDHAGISTYDSLYRAKEIFGLKKVIIVTQKYHLYRSLYIAKKLGLDAYGVDATKEIFYGQTKREIRELLARVKDFAKVLFKPQSKFLGHKISISGDGNKTNDDYMLITSKDNKEYFIYNKDKIKSVSNLIESYDFKKETCDGISNYKLVVNGNIEYAMEVYEDTVHILKLDDSKSKEIVLNKEDSTLIFDMIS